jgi:hypothetical protein
MKASHTRLIAHRRQLILNAEFDVLVFIFVMQTTHNQQLAMASSYIYESLEILAMVVLSFDDRPREHHDELENVLQGLDHRDAIVKRDSTFIQPGERIKHHDFPVVSHPLQLCQNSMIVPRFGKDRDRRTVLSESDKFLNGIVHLFRNEGIAIRVINRDRQRLVPGNIWDHGQGITIHHWFSPVITATTQERWESI